MELSNIKKWVKPAIVALPSKRILLILLLGIIAFIWLATPLFNRFVYPLEYEEHIRNSAKYTGADPFLVMAVIRVETKFEPDKRSHVGAQGLMQLMPGTVEDAIERGYFSPSVRDYIEDPATNIQMGSWYIAALTREFEGNKVVVAAAYNAGPGNVKKWLKNGTWDGTRQNVDQIPFGETKQYVQRVTYYYEKYKQVYGEKF
ncbi:lytic transglycosylase domain-containing protein [Hazenella sp. IB182357]|uniref:Lytic transglycosylase domain-containing protein n=1 Tax=Polycladospora coralii TaxID=2771432 RepID=A0A926NGA5_9BACL|nr:lytic transglycosylase domain-containing protein [Polycladospora coralii]MBD1372798.1 lytic transglycosylase domain-containing protein [Polycladospora coralii]MBS7529504.1 lytic transglycosylase domain-containing protein [Polycladospora coralii]